MKQTTCPGFAAADAEYSLYCIPLSGKKNNGLLAGYHKTK
jgi:hypothetical protein